MRALSTAQWQHAALNAPAAFVGLWLRRLVCCAVILLGMTLLAGVARVSVYMTYLPALLDILLHIAAIGVVMRPPQGPMFDGTNLPSAQVMSGHLLWSAQRAAQRLARVRMLRRLVATEVGVLFLAPIVRTLWINATLQWSWQFTVATAVLLLVWPLERMLVGTAREQRRLGRLVLSERS